jgi:D-glycero-alpha-D-manno-heptose-7-phosphate kinase
VCTRQGGPVSVKRVLVRAAARVDLAGGSLDLWPIGQIVAGASTLNMAISLAASVECRPTGTSGVRLSSRDLLANYQWHPGDPPGPLALIERLCELHSVTDGWEIQSWSDVPPGSGLGGSSAMAVAVILALGAISGTHRTHSEMALLCRDVEAAHLRTPTGVQDYWPALKGGVLCIEYRPGWDRVETLKLPLKTIASRLVVAYSGVSRLSADTNWSLCKRFLDGDPDVRGRMEGIADVAKRMRIALEGGDWDRCGLLLSEEWQHRKGLSDGLSTPSMENLMDRATQAGALGGKACGAGGGGCLAFWVREGARLEVERALEREGARVLPAHPVPRGHVLEVEP